MCNDLDLEDRYEISDTIIIVVVVVVFISHFTLIGKAAEDILTKFVSYCVSPTSHSFSRSEVKDQRNRVTGSACVSISTQCCHLVYFVTVDFFFNVCHTLGKSERNTVLTPQHIIASIRHSVKRIRKDYIYIIH